eukprot:Rhum_TRINITY_DN25435_c0_g1::Rhum_TRINITY_DN25435_c0_g1_i1::g.182039::m.182039/K02738/PSMB6; 20S proteasome subunit beta 1
MTYMQSMAAGAEIEAALRAQHARLTHDQKVETFRADDVEVMNKTVHKDEEETMGTTILAAVFKDGVVLASDTQTSYGSLVADYAAPKITKLTDHIWILRSGNAADTMMIAKIVRRHILALEIQMGQEVPVKAAARLVQLIVFNNRRSLSAGMIVGGWDSVDGGQVFSILSDGAKSKVPYALGGSGSLYIYGWADSTFKTGMTELETKAWLKQAVAHAKARDGGSGYNTRTTTITKDGAVEEFFPWGESPFRLETDEKWQTHQETVIPK